MIKRLHIRNYAIIEALEVDFSEGMTIITGETGAGKSILLGALGLILGERSDAKVLYNEAERCIVEGIFDLKKYDLRAKFDLHEIEYDPDEVIIRREIAPNGKSRAFINDSPANLTALKDITGALIDLHQQFDTLDLQNTSLQLQMVDALAGHKPTLLEYRKSYREYAALQRKHSEMVEMQSRSARELEFLQFQLNELEEAKLDPAEQTKLELERDRLQNAEDIARKLSAASNALSEGEQPILGVLRSIQQQLQSVSKYHPQIPTLVTQLDQCFYELEELAKSCDNIAEATEFDPKRFEEVQVRLDALYRLFKKHGVPDVTALVALRDQTALQVDQLGDLSGEISRIDKQIAQSKTLLEILATTISQGRADSKLPFEEKIHALLGQLGMEHARLMVMIEPTVLGPDGSDNVHFLFASNKGSRLLPIKDVASGGELSRLSLVTKSLVAASIPLPTLIFDEIDAGVSGDIALKMGRILEELATHHQICVITHSPQVAARGDKHYFVYKSIREDRTLTHVRSLNHEERVRSIAVMLSQNPPGDAALANAKELMGG
jgi:DNA repair protein RecN (Recombination protein N)